MSAAAPPILPSQPSPWPAVPGKLRHGGAVFLLALALHAAVWLLWPAAPSPQPLPMAEPVLRAVWVPLAAPAKPAPPTPPVRPQTPIHRQAPVQAPAQPFAAAAAPAAPQAPPDPGPAPTVAAPAPPHAPEPLPAPPPAPALPQLVSSGVEYLRPPQPEYPQAARRRGDEGQVMVRVLIDTSGHVAQARIETSSGIKSLDQAGIQAVAKALFKPHMENGKAIAVYALVPINFKINI